MKNITQVIKEYLIQKDVKAAQLARMCNTTQPNMSKKLAQNDMELSWVIRISAALNHNFLFDMANEIGIKYETKDKPINIEEFLRGIIRDEISKQPKQPYARLYSTRTIHADQVNEPTGTDE